MSHETGIVASHDLKNRISSYKQSSDIRAVKVVISNEDLIFDSEFVAQSSFEKDFARLTEFVEDKKACYMLVRTDQSGAGDQSLFEWLLISYVPSDSSTREKMLYSSTKASMKREFGTEQLKLDYYATEVADLTHQNFLISQDRSEKPFTEQELEILRVKEQERQTMRGLGDRVKLASNVAFPPTEEALEAITKFGSGSLNFVQFVINPTDEVVEHSTSHQNLSMEEVDGVIPRDRATYNMYRVPVMASDNFIKDYPVIFIHAMSNNSGVKERMLFSSCKSPFLQLLTGEELGILIDRKVEVDMQDEAVPVSAQFIISEVQVKQETQTKLFSRPKAPGRQRTGAAK